MAIINVDDAYILNEVGAQVDKTTGIPFKNESLTEAEAAQARANIRAGGSNRNLLDNAYFVGGGSQLGDGIFPINQRGQTSYGASTRAFDRWITESGSSVTLSSNGATFSGSTVSLYDGAAAANLVGKTVTISAQLGDGTIISGTGVVNLLSQDTTIQAWLPTGGYVGFFIFANAQSYQFCRIYSGSATLIRAVKLELGTVSTLANDPPPDFGEELRKCQRYLWCKTFPQYTQIGTGVATDANNCVIDVVLPATMRTGATITFTANVLLIGAGGAIVAASVSAINIIDNHARINAVAASSMVTHNTYSFITSAETTMTISAEL